MNKQLSLSDGVYANVAGARRRELIEKLLAEGRSKSEVARMFGISSQRVYDIHRKMLQKSREVMREANRVDEALAGV